MKKTFTLLAILFIITRLSSQAPERMSYQAIVRNTKGELVVNQPIGMKISIYYYVSKTLTVTAYAETHTASTNENGLVTIAIGTGTVVKGVFADIKWSSDYFYIKTEIDPKGKDSYSITSETQLISVPYALYAKNAEGLTLPYFSSGNYSTTPFSVENTGSAFYSISGLSNLGFGVYGKTKASSASGVIGYGTGADFSSGVIGMTGESYSEGLPGNTGVLGSSDAHIAVGGTALSGTGGYFSSRTGLAVHTKGSIKLTGINEAAKRVLTSDVAGTATWQDRSTKVSAFQPVGCKELANVTTIWQKIADMGTATKKLADTWLEVNVQTTIYVENFLTGTTAVIYELRVGGLATTIGNATCLIKYSKTFTPVSITGIFSNLKAGEHIISLWAKSVNGNATDAFYDRGCYNNSGINNVLIKEYY